MVTITKAARLQAGGYRTPLEAANDQGAAELAAAELGQWGRIVERLGLPLHEAQALALRAQTNAAPFARELLMSGRIAEAALYRELAAELDLAFAESVDPETLILRERDDRAALRRKGGALLLRAERPGKMPAILYAPERLDISSMRERVGADASLKERISIVAPSVLRKAVLARAEEHMAAAAAATLFTAYPRQSARIVVDGRQGFLVGTLAIGFPVAFMAAPLAAGLFLHLVLSLFFLGCVGLRLAAALIARPPRLEPLRSIDPAGLPFYSVLVAIYDEAEIVPDLLVALSRIEWPRSKLEIKLVCEADDHATLEAIEAHGLRPYVEVIRVPPGEPRTKPKALSYARNMVCGDFIVLYDAEDRPHPQQLLEAWQKFAAAGDGLACVQAPLTAANADCSWTARMFAFEYAGLFRGMLPWLAAKNLMIPLGGTSNHFRAAALDHCLGWDPHNVTEDADLGLRLARFGYRTEMITRPTAEDAPEAVGTWLRQRSRWFKGWLQTWLVHMREPRRLANELGLGSFLVCQTLIAGMVLSALAHPVFVLTVAYMIVVALLDDMSFWRQTLLVVDGINVSLGYVAFIAIGWRTLKPQERRGLWKTVALTPPYWFLLSAAALRALWKLVREPHRWEKTPHFRHRKPRPARRSAASAPARL